jgi:hypothetical protein
MILNNSRVRLGSKPHDASCMNVAVAQPAKISRDKTYRKALHKGSRTTKKIQWSPFRKKTRFVLLTLPPVTSRSVFVRQETLTRQYRPLWHGAVLKTFAVVYVCAVP